MDFKKVSVIGLGKSGLSAARFFKKKGCEVFASDAKPWRPENPAVRELAGLGVKSEWGGHTRSVLDSELIVLSPGVLPDIPILNEARQIGIPIWPEIEAAYRFCPAPIIAVTGTNGKSTVAALTGHLFSAAGWDARVVGNIGTPLLNEMETVTPATWVVMEVSSFQLETIVDFRPKISCIMTITQDHLNRHPDIKTYAKAKARILENQTADDIAILNRDDPVVRNLAGGAKCKIIWFSASEIEGVFPSGRKILWKRGNEIRTLASAEKFPLPGKHNLQNLTAACAICAAAGLTPIEKGIEDFKGLAHRLEFVAGIGGVDYYDDSKGTNPDAVECALSAFDGPVVLVAGGQDKGLDFSGVIKAARGKVKAVVALGKNNAKILQTFSFVPDRVGVGDMESAVKEAHRRAQAGDVVLLSPGCASFDLFASAEDRGEQFQARVRDLDNIRTSRKDA